MSETLDSWLVQHPKVLGALTTLVVLLAHAGNALAVKGGTVSGP